MHSVWCSVKRRVSKSPFPRTKEKNVADHKSTYLKTARHEIIDTPVEFELIYTRLKIVSVITTLGFKIPLFFTIKIHSSICSRDIEMTIRFGVYSRWLYVICKYPNLSFSSSSYSLPTNPQVGNFINIFPEKQNFHPPLSKKQRKCP